MKTVAEKMGIKDGSQTIFINAPKDAIVSIQLPDVKLKKSLSGGFDYIHLFAKNQKEQLEWFPKLKKHLNSEGRLWISWPKNKQLETDLTLPKVIEIGYSFGLVESVCLSINEVWSALKFTHPKGNKKYNNSYGTLVNRTTKR